MRNASDNSTIAVSFVPVCATNHFRLSVACSDRRKAFGDLVIIRVYHSVLLFAIRKFMHCMKKTWFLLVKYAYVTLLEKDKPLFFSCVFSSKIPPVECNIRPIGFYVKDEFLSCLRSVAVRAVLLTSVPSVLTSRRADGR